MPDNTDKAAYNQAIADIVDATKVLLTAFQPRAGEAQLPYLQLAYNVWQDVQKAKSADRFVPKVPGNK